MDKSLVKYICTNESFDCAFIPHAVRWLDWDVDFKRARDFWGPQWYAGFEGIWKEARELGYQYCAVIKRGEIIARAAVWRFSDEAWDCAAVYVKEAYQRQGYGKAVCAFITAHILACGRIATCHTSIDNLPMQRLAESLGFYRADAK